MYSTERFFSVTVSLILSIIVWNSGRAHEAIFNIQETVEKEGYTYHLDYTSLQDLRKFNILYYYIEQNPDK